MASPSWLLARLGAIDDPSTILARYRLSDLVAGLLAVLAVAALLIAVGYAFYFLQTLPWRRRERAVLLLDLLDSGLACGQTVEQTVIAASRTRDGLLPVRLHLLAAHLESGRSLADALDLCPRLLPPSVSALLQLGARHGVLPRVLPACRMALDAPPETRMMVAQQIALVLVLSTMQCVSVLGILIVAVLPKFRQIMADMTGTESARLVTTMSAAGWIAALNLVLGALIAGWWFARIGGPRAWVGRIGLVSAFADHLLRMVPWRRTRMRRDVAAALAVLLDAGIPEAVAVREAAMVTGSRWFQNRAMEAAEAMAKGVPLIRAVTRLDDAGELGWRLTNARHGRTGFLAALRGWIDGLDARAHSQELTAAQVFVTAGLLLQGLAVGLVVTGMFGALVQITEGAVNW